jgi:hypothetical protein
MNADESTQRLRAGVRPPARIAGALLTAAVVAACAGENLFTFGARSGDLLGPRVQITAPIGTVTLLAGDSVRVTANITSQQGVTEVSWTGVHDGGGAAPFNPIVVPLAGVRDTTMSRYMTRLDGTPAGTAKIVVTARDLVGDSGADTISVTLQ